MMPFRSRSVNQEMIIRPMQLDDFSQVHIIDQFSFNNPWPRSAYRFEILENQNSYTWLAEIDERITAVIVCWLILDEIHIATLAVHPEFRKQGVGKQIVIHALQTLIPKGALSATLEVRAGNQAAQNLYHHFGFRKVGQRKHYYKDSGEDAILMTAEPFGPDYLDWLFAGAQVPWQNSTPPGRISGSY
jgi:ribosomal-protein-alanine N-acetyltransferase